MTDLPKGWATAMLGEVADVVAGQSPSGSVVNEAGKGLPFFQGKAEFGDVYPEIRKWTTSAPRTADPGDVLLSVRAPVGPTNLAPVDCAIGRGLMAIRQHPSFADRYLLWAIRSSAEQLRSFATGSTFEAVTGPVVRQHVVAVAPPAEQERIVGAIEEAFSKLDAGEAGLRTVRQLLRRMRDAVLTAAVTGRLVPQDPTDTPATKLLADLGIETIEEDELLPPGWSVATLDDAVGHGAITDGPFGSNLKTEHYTTSGPRVVRLQNIGDGEFRDEEVHISEAHFQRLRKHEVYAGDVLVASLGEVLPRACIAPPWLGPAIVKADCIRVRPGRALAGSFLEVALNSRPIRSAVSSSIKGVGRPRLNLGELRRVTLPVPPIEEQVRIGVEVDRQFSFLEAVQSGIAVGLERGEMLRRSVLKAAFEGKLVPQDPTDEPASELLDRIRAERAAAPKIKTRRAGAKA